MQSHRREVLIKKLPLGFVFTLAAVAWFSMRYRTPIIEVGYTALIILGMLSIWSAHKTKKRKTAGVRFYLKAGEPIVAGVLLMLLETEIYNLLT